MRNSAVSPPVGGSYWLGLLACSLVATASAPASCATFTTIFSFDGGHGGPAGKLRAPPTTPSFFRGTILGLAATPDDGPYGHMGSVYRYRPSTGGITSLFTDSQLLFTYGGLTVLGDYAYGTDGGGGGGVVYRVDPKAKTSTVVYSFGSGMDGNNPTPLVAVGAKLYGATVSGGTNNDGILYSLDPATDQETVLYNQTDSIANPLAVTVVGGVVYGVTASGGTLGYGSVFKYDPATSQETVLFSFNPGTPIGASPGTALVSDDMALFGTASGVEYLNYGAIFRTALATGKTTDVYAFTSPATEGKYVNAELVRYQGSIYGTTSQGGPGNAGTVFSVDLKTKALTVLHGFTGGADGGNPKSGLIIHNGVLYGTTTAGGAHSRGTIYTVVP